MINGQGRQSGIKSVGAQRGGAGNFGVFLPRNGEKIEANSGRGRKSVGARAPTAPTSLTPLTILLHKSTKFILSR